MKTASAVFGLLLAPSLLFAESIRCGSQLIEKGSTSADLLEYCGKPAQIVSNGTVTGLTGNTYTSEGITSQATGDFEVEMWTYDFGPNQLMERVRIENGIVVRIPLIVNAGVEHGCGAVDWTSMFYLGVHDGSRSAVRPTFLIRIMPSRARTAFSSIRRVLSARFDDSDEPADLGLRRPASARQDKRAMYRRVTGWRSASSRH